MCLKYELDVPTSPHESTNRLISKDGNTYPPEKISRIDGQTLGIIKSQHASRN